MTVIQSLFKFAFMEFLVWLDNLFYHIKRLCFKASYKGVLGQAELKDKLSTLTFISCSCFIIPNITFTTIFCIEFVLRNSDWFFPSALQESILISFLRSVMINWSYWAELLIPATFRICSSTTVCKLLLLQTTFFIRWCEILQSYNL